MNDLTRYRAIGSAREALLRECQAIMLQEKALGSAFLDAVQLVLRVRGRVVLAGTGKSWLIAKRAAATLSSLGTPAGAMHAGDALHGDLGMLTRNDLIIAISVSGETAETRRAVRDIRLILGAGVPIIAITRRADSSIGKQANHVLPLFVQKEACHLGLAPTASLAEASALLDALAVSVSEVRGFTREDFAKLHPGGTLGRAHLTVRDIMRTGSACPRVYAAASLKDALLEMTRTRLGAVAVVDPGGVLLGFFTDGDIRRRLQGGADVSVPVKGVSCVMSKDPATIGPDATLRAAAQAMAEASCDNLPVVDAAGKLIGVVDERDVMFDAGAL